MLIITVFISNALVAIIIARTDKLLSTRIVAIRAIFAAVNLDVVV
jgi:hypothetical protein